MRKHIKRAVSCLLVLAMVGCLTGCTTYNNFKAAFFPGDKVAQEKTIKIGIYEATSGKLSDQGKQEVMGIELANELYGTVLDKKVELIYGDNQSSMYVGETVIQELISQNPSVILGSCGETVTLIASDYIKAASIPAITISSTNPLITANNEFYFSATFTETRQGDALADYAYTGREKDVVATVKMQNDDTATATIKRFTNRMKKLSGDSKCIVGSYELPVDSGDYTQVIEAIRESGAKAVFLAVQPAAAQAFLQQAVDLRLTHVTWLGDRSWNNEDLLDFVKSQPKLDVAFPSDFSQKVSTSRTEEFVQAYKKKYGEAMEPSEATAIAFDAYLLALQAIEEAQSTVMELTEDQVRARYETEATQKAAIAEWKQARETGIPTGRQIKMMLEQIENFNGASGIISYNGKNEATKSITINYISGGEEQTAYVVG